MAHRDDGGAAPAGHDDYLLTLGRRFLNKGNSVTAEDYTAIDARVGWKFAGGWGAFVEGENLTDRRDPVTESELGDAQFYRMPGRRIVGTISYGY